MSLEHLIDYFGKPNKDEEKEDRVLQDIYKRHKCRVIGKPEPLTENEELFLR